VLQVCITSAVKYAATLESALVLKTLQLLSDAGYPPLVSMDCLYAAVEREHTMELLTYLLDRIDHHHHHQNMGPLILRAVATGNIEVVEELERRFPGSFDAADPLLMSTAAEMGSVAMLEYLSGRGCIADHRVLQFALMNNHVEATKWAVDNPRCPLYIDCFHLYTSRYMYIHVIPLSAAHSE
jgi:hypothetical protein